MKKGFTLIELLVVVLIIGILSAIAVPKYQNAVRNAKFGKLMPVTKAMSAAVERYYVKYNTFPKNFDDLDIKMPDGGIINTPDTIRSTYLNGDMYCQITVFGYAFCIDKSIKNGIAIFTPHTVYGPNNPTGISSAGNSYCIAYPGYNNEPNAKFCESLKMAGQPGLSSAFTDTDGSIVSCSYTRIK